MLGVALRAPLCVGRSCPLIDIVTTYGDSCELLTPASSSCQTPLPLLAPERSRICPAEAAGAPKRGAVAAPPTRASVQLPDSQKPPDCRLDFRDSPDLWALRCAGALRRPSVYVAEASSAGPSAPARLSCKPLSLPSQRSSTVPVGHIRLRESQRHPPASSWPQVLALPGSPYAWLRRDRAPKDHRARFSLPRTIYLRPPPIANLGQL